MEPADLLSTVSSNLTNINFVLKKSSGLCIQGKVSKDNKAVPGMQVDAFSDSAMNHMFGISDEQGYYTITGLKDFEDYKISVWSDTCETRFYYYSPENDMFKTNTAINAKSSRSLANKIKPLSPCLSNIDLILPDESMYNGTISGNVSFVDGRPCSGIIVEAWSNELNDGKFAITDAFGSYTITKLNQMNPSQDYIVSVSSDISGKLISYQAYDLADTNENASLVQKGETQINFILEADNILEYPNTATREELETIFGTVRDIYSRPVEGIWISAWSELQHAGFGALTKQDGSYEIKGLPKSDDYKLVAEPNSQSLYIAQEKYQVSSNSQSIDFTLQKGHTFIGNVFDTKNYPIPNARVELRSLKSNYSNWLETDQFGQFIINGLPCATDYILSIYSPNKASYIPYIAYDLTITESITKTIFLKHGYSIKGKIYTEVENTPIPNIRITASSSSQNFYAQAVSDDHGQYEIKDIPQAFDYELIIVSALYAKMKKLGIASGANVDFQLTPGGTISGYIKTPSGNGIPNVHVEIESRSIQSVDIGLTDKYGYYSVNGLNTQDHNENIIGDYVVQIYPMDYPFQSQGPIQPGQSANFICIKQKENQLSGFVQDEHGNELKLEDDKIIIVKVYKNKPYGGYIKKTQVNSDGSFIVEGLNSHTMYQLKFIWLQNNIAITQWAGSNCLGITERSEAILYNTSDTIYFRFCSSNGQ
jgi:hypothetical protein